MKTFTRLLLLASALGWAGLSQAHHSFSATFQEGQKITREGVVTEFSFRNPHILVYFDVTNEDGSVTGWVSEGAAATLMRRRGWAADTLEPGDNIRVYGDSTHDGTPMTSIDTLDIIDPNSGSVVSALMDQDGRQRQNAVSAKAAPMPLTLPDGSPNITGAWTNHGMANGRPRRPEVSFSEAGAALQAKFELANDGQVFCDPPGLVRQVGVTPHPIRITQLDDKIVFDYEEYGGHREVFFDDRAHLGVNTHFGDSTARYEGDSLIVETTNLLSNQVSPEGNVLSDQATTKEVYTRADDDTYGPVLRLNMYVEDPVNLSETLVLSRDKMSAGKYDFIENDCHAPLREREKVHSAMNFFVASEPVDEAQGADAQCASLASAVGQGTKTWRGLSTVSELSGQGPYYTAKGELLAEDLSNLNSDAGYLQQISLVDERGSPVDKTGDNALYCVSDS